ncbi:MAG: isocitrate lyase/phosphoenolpyruvate mutase family protein [Vampirovibrionales bacterium]|nr:isocitrate lyase/phosphoenolpyruvate mutase family protein [Vampirovibrionales bacterium]
MDPVSDRLPNISPLLNPGVDKPARLRRLLNSGQPLALPGAFNAISAQIIEAVGFDAVYVSGAGLNNGVAGYPDIGMLGLEEMAQLAGFIARATHLPAIADADTGFGEAAQTFRATQSYERQGLAGFHLEDQVFPKRCGHLEGKTLIPAEAMAEKIRAAVAARLNPDFLIIARTDARAVEGLEAALARAQTYLAAGADMIFPEALTTPGEFETFAQGLRARYPAALLLANMTEFGKTPLLTLSDFAAIGYNAVLYPMTAFRVMMRAVEDAMRQLRRDGGQAGLLSRMTDRKALYALLRYPAYDALGHGDATTRDAP